jgi:branched-chain amino acid transport system permease protein
MEFKKAHLNLILMVAIILLAILPVLGEFPMLLHILIVIFMYATICEGWNLIGGYVGYVSLGHAMFFGIGAYTVALTLKNYAWSPLFTVPIGGALAVIIAILIGFPSLRLRGAYFVITTLAVNYVFELMVTNMDWLTYGAMGVFLPPPSFSPSMTKIVYYEAYLILMLATTFLCHRIANSKFGQGLIAIHENEDAAESIGIPTTKYKLLAFALSSLPPAIAGGLYSPYMTYIDPSTVFSVMISLNAILMTTIGGAGTVVGPIIGAGLLVTLSELMVHIFVREFNYVMYGALLLFTVIVMPGGIMRIIKRWKLARV